MLIWQQRPEASFVSGVHTWHKCNRYVRRGEKGVAILAPMFFKDKRQATDGSGEGTRRIWFRVVYVFDRLSRDLLSDPLRARRMPRVDLLLDGQAHHCSTPRPVQRYLMQELQQSASLLSSNSGVLSANAF
jgi:hypothetical protein